MRSFPSHRTRDGHLIVHPDCLYLDRPEPAPSRSAVAIGYITAAISGAAAMAFLLKVVF